MKLSLFHCYVLTALFVLLSITAMAQRPSEAAYSSWKSDLSSQAVSPEHLGFGFAAWRSDKGAVTVDISVAVGSDVNTLQAYEFVVQPLAMNKNAKGEIDLVEVGSPSLLTSGAMSSLTRLPSGVVLQPQITARVPENADAIRIVAKGSDNGGQTYTVVLRLKDTPSTAVLAKQ